MAWCFFYTRASGRGPPPDDHPDAEPVSPRKDRIAHPLSVAAPPGDIRHAHSDRSAFRSTARLSAELEVRTPGQPQVPSLRAPIKARAPGLAKESAGIRRARSRAQNEGNCAVPLPTPELFGLEPTLPGACRQALTLSRAFELKRFLLPPLEEFRLLRDGKCQNCARVTSLEYLSPLPEDRARPIGATAS